MECLSSSDNSSCAPTQVVSTSSAVGAPSEASGGKRPSDSFLHRRPNKHRSAETGTEVPLIAQKTLHVSQELLRLNTAVDSLGKELAVISEILVKQSSVGLEMLSLLRNTQELLYSMAEESRDSDPPWNQEEEERYHQLFASILETLEQENHGTPMLISQNQQHTGSRSSNPPKLGGTVTKDNQDASLMTIPGRSPMPPSRGF